MARPHAIAVATRNAVLAVKNALGAAPAGCVIPPDNRVWITHNLPAVEGCDQINIWLGNVQPDNQFASTQVATQRNRCAIVWGVTVNIDVWVCVQALEDSGAHPQPAVQEAEAECIDFISWGLQCGLSSLISSDGLLPGVNCEDVRWGPTVPLGPEGGTAGRRLAYTVRTDCA